MELEDYKKINISGKELIPETEEGLCVQDLYKRVDTAIKNSIKKARKHVAFLLVLTIIYLSAALTGGLSKGLLIIASGFLAGAVYIVLRYRSLPDEYYFLPLIEFIRIAKNRLNYFILADWLVIPPIIILLGIGGGIHLVYRLSRYTDAKGLIIVIWVIFYIGVCIFGYFAGRKNWNKEHGNLIKYLEKFNGSL